MVDALSVLRDSQIAWRHADGFFDGVATHFRETIVNEHDPACNGQDDAIGMCEEERLIWVFALRSCANIILGATGRGSRFLYGSLGSSVIAVRQVRFLSRQTAKPAALRKTILV